MGRNDVTRNYIIQRLIWIVIILLTTLTITFFLLKTAPEYPPTKLDQKDTWLERQVTDGYYTREYYNEDDADELAEYFEIKAQASEDGTIDKTVFFVPPQNDS